MGKNTIHITWIVLKWKVKLSPLNKKGNTRRPLYLGEENLTMTSFPITLERIPQRLLTVATLVGTRATGDVSPQGTTQTHFKG